MPIWIRQFVLILRAANIDWRDTLCAGTEPYFTVESGSLVHNNNLFRLMHRLQIIYILKDPWVILFEIASCRYFLKTIGTILDRQGRSRADNDSAKFHVSFCSDLSARPMRDTYE